MVASQLMTARQAEALDKLLDVIAQEVVERYLAEFEAEQRPDDQLGASSCPQ